MEDNIHTRLKVKKSTAMSWQSIDLESCIYLHELYIINKQQGHKFRYG